MSETLSHEMRCELILPSVTMLYCNSPHQLHRCVNHQDHLFSTTRVPVVRRQDLVRVPPSVEPLPLRQCLDGTSNTLTALEWLNVAPPVDLDLSPLDAEQHNDPSDRDGSRERSRQDEVVLGPEPEPSVLDKDPAEPGNGHRGPSIREAVGRPPHAAVPDGYGVELPDPPAPREVLDQCPEDDWSDDAKGEPQKQRCVLPLVPEDLCRPNGTP